MDAGSALLLGLSVVVGVVGVEDPVGPILVALETGVLLPIWAIWLGLRAAAGPDVEAAAAT